VKAVHLHRVVTSRAPCHWLPACAAWL